LEAVKQNGYALLFASCMYRDEELMLEAVKQNGYCLDYDEELYNYRMNHCYHDLYIKK